MNMEKEIMDLSNSLIAELYEYYKDESIEKNETPLSLEDFTSKMKYEGPEYRWSTALTALITYVLRHNFDDIE
jgi:hypothetical protein